MAIGGGRISLPLAIGVDRGHLKAIGSGSWPLPMAESIYLSFLVLWFAEETNRAIEGGRISPPSRWGGSRPPLVAGSIFFFFFLFFFFSLVGGGWWVIYLVA
jgi:hypothetical protein